MGRLTKCEGERISCNVSYCPEDCNTCEMYKDIRDKLAHYEDLEEQGRLISIEPVKGYEDGKAEAMQWIPVSEREPKEPEDGFKRYIVQRASNAEPRSLYWDQYGTWLDEEGTPYTDIIAWMPLPEPYKKGEQKCYITR